MNDDFGSISSDFLPPGYGEIPGKVQQRVGEEAPTTEDASTLEEDYGKWRIFGGEGTEAGIARRAERTADDGDDAPDTEKSLFWKNLAAGSKARRSARKERRQDRRSDRQEEREEAANTPCIREGGGYKYQQNPDNSIVILKTPTKRGHGTKYAANHKAAKKVLKQFGPCEAQETGVSAFMSALLGGGSATSASTGGAAGFGAGLAAAASQLLPALASILGPQTDSPLDDDDYDYGPGGPGGSGGSSAGTGGGAPWGMIIGGIAVVGLLGGIYMATRDDDEDEDEE